MAALLRELQERLLNQQQLPARQFRSLEGKLGALEGSVLSAGGARPQHSPSSPSVWSAQLCSLMYNFTSLARHLVLLVMRNCYHVLHASSLCPAAGADTPDAAATCMTGGST